MCKILICLAGLFFIVSLIPTLMRKITCLLYLEFFSYFKLGITLIKYSPQVRIIKSLIIWLITFCLFRSVSVKHGLLILSNLAFCNHHPGLTSDEKTIFWNLQNRVITSVPVSTRRCFYWSHILLILNFWIKWKYSIPNGHNMTSDTMTDTTSFLR